MKAEVEVERLESRIKEIAFKKQAELEEAARDKTMTLINSGCIEQIELHVDIDNQRSTETITSSLVSGDIEPTELLFDTDNQMEKAKKDALSRKDILDLVRSWLLACEEERWLEYYYQVIIIFHV
jgi:protein regulator of cytokinesis 1